MAEHNLDVDGTQVRFLVGPYTYCNKLYIWVFSLLIKDEGVMKIKKRVGYTKGAQVTIFVILAIVIVGAIGFFVVRNNLPVSIPSSINPAYTHYLECLEKAGGEGAELLGSQAGYIEKPDFSFGNQYAPFSSELAFMGRGVPYWYYISNNGLRKEQVPTITSMNKELGNYLLNYFSCDFSEFVNQGFEITFGKASSAKALISDKKIALSIEQKLTFKKGEETFVVNSHKTEIDSSLGELYKLAKKVYDYEKESSFLENYSLDVLYTYAPVSGVELNCSPVIWNPYNVVGNLKNALEANLQTLKIEGGYYSLKTGNYFVIGKGKLDSGNKVVRMVYSSSWPSRFEVWPTKKNLMIANPIGTQQGLTSMGFCYAPYKFVYDMFFPVLIQVSNADYSEVFQFPVAVVIDKNFPREALDSEYYEDAESNCENTNADLTVNTYSLNLEPVEADLEFKCLNSICDIGKTSLENNSGVATLTTKVPACVNGFIIANAEGYSEKRYQISTNSEAYADLILEREYKLALEVYVDGSLTNANSILVINEILSNGTNFYDSASYPSNSQITLKPGNYNFDLKVFRNGNLVIPASTIKQCLKEPQGGLFGLVLGLEKDKCYDIEIPSQTITNVIYAGGKVNSFFTEDMIAGASKLKVYAESVSAPTSLEDAQNAYDSIELKKIIVEAN